MLKMYLCKNCKSIYSAEEWEPHECSKCRLPLVALGISDENWAKLEESQKITIISNEIGISEPVIAPNIEPAAEELSPLEAIRADIYTIKNILVFYLVASIVVAVIALITLL